MSSVYVGVLIAESLRIGATAATPMRVTRIERVQPGNTSADQPATWTLLHVEVDAAVADRLAEEVAEALDQPGWYADFRSDDDAYVIFPGRVLHYRRSDSAARAEALEVGLQYGVPQSQLDWPA